MYIDYLQFFNYIDSLDSILYFDNVYGRDTIFWY